MKDISALLVIAVLQMARVCSLRKIWVLKLQQNSSSGKGMWLVKVIGALLVIAESVKWHGCATSER